MYSLFPRYTFSVFTALNDMMFLVLQLAVTRARNISPVLALSKVHARASALCACLAPSQWERMALFRIHCLGNLRGRRGKLRREGWRKILWMLIQHLIYHFLGGVNKPISYSESFNALPNRPCSAKTRSTFN